MVTASVFMEKLQKLHEAQLSSNTNSPCNVFFNFLFFFGLFVCFLFFPYFLFYFIFFILLLLLCFIFFLYFIFFYSYNCFFFLLIEHTNLKMINKTKFFINHKTVYGLR